MANNNDNMGLNLVGIIGITSLMLLFTELSMRMFVWTEVSTLARLGIVSLGEILLYTLVVCKAAETKSLRGVVSAALALTAIVVVANVLWLILL
jgi:hypothetical protein